VPCDNKCSEASSNLGIGQCSGDLSGHRVPGFLKSFVNLAARSAVTSRYESGFELFETSLNTANTAKGQNKDIVGVV
jgi:hypothetical protein